MRFFVDSVDIVEIKKLTELGLVDGVTTNPSLIAKSGQNFLETIEKICAVVAGPVSAEVAATDYEDMILEGRKLAKIAKNVAIKLPLIENGVRACKTLASEGYMVNLTLCFSVSQALLAAKAGAAFVSPFVGRLDDIGIEGMDLIDDVVKVFSNYEFSTQVLVASVRNPNHVVEAALMGADIVTLPPSVLWKLFDHPLTEKGLQLFLADWEKTGQAIL
ncbi:MAG: fructose-6-phosphate aldolase [Magnetovibrio sp.]|nr:fructose-6-phosphate aldolase [Magnetovibrio sp.]